ncbi:hypothetical protein [Streptomyces sporangiiformans]|uniref:DUF1963 domain-containing protein n=1 Tax=Streptomyces sporangiiformans TaxID=2315329 RepID=A0A505DKU1_9ACTN|nr:hypothetical protein [Streptomyces sporangiiformans]TPQ19729.1 hypothetical protein FGD71_024055 [Streptomyces sporangiiformans]
MARTTPERPVDIEEVIPELSGYRGLGTRLHPRPGAPRPEQSSVGGPFLWPADEPWPTCTEPHRRRFGERLSDVRLRRKILAEAWSRRPGPGQSEGPTDEEFELLRSLRRGRHAPWLADTDPIPLMPVAQLYTRDVPGLSLPGDADVLQVFWCPFNAHGEERGVAVHMHWRKTSDISAVQAEQPELEVVGREEYVPDPCVLHPEQVTEHQWGDLLPFSIRSRLDEWEDWEDEEAVSYQFDLSVPPGWKVGGYAPWPLTGPQEMVCGCGRQMELLLTIDSREWDKGTRSWIPLEDRDVADTEANTPTQIVVGRGGRLMVFVCSSDWSHPHRVVLQ